MQIAVTDTSPAMCAINLDDKRVSKLLLEAGQLLCVWAEDQGIAVPYRRTKQGKVFVKWMQADVRNYAWTRHYFECLCGEFVHRFGKKHKTHVDVLHLLPRLPTMFYPPSSFVNAARHQGRGLDFTHLPVPLSYRAYLDARWDTDKRPPMWTRRHRPGW